MNKKFFAKALIAAAAFVSTIASAAITYDNSVTDAIKGTYVQTNNAVATPGGGSVRANDLIIMAGLAADIPADAEIIVRLPAGVNFSEKPGYLVGPAVQTQGLTLKDTSVFGDPTLDAPQIDWFDTNADGGMDRAVVTANAAGAAGDTLTISVNLSVNAGVTAGVKKASIIVNGGLAVTQNIVEVKASLAEPVATSSGTALSTVDQGANANVAVTTASFTVTVPKGTAGGTKLTMTPQSKLTFATGGTTLTYTISSPLTANPFTAATAFAAGPGTASISFTVAGATTTSTSDDVQVTFTANQVDTVAGGTIGARGLALSGAATGVASLVDVKQNGSSASLTSLTVDATNTNPVIVAGSSAPQALPSIVVTENFDGDAGGTGILAGTSTITITAGTNLVFSTASVPTFAGGTWAATATVTATKVTVTILTNDATVDLTIDGILATAKTGTTGNMSLTVGAPGVGNDSTTGPASVLTVASAKAVGVVTVTGPITTAIKKTGPGAAAVTSTITLKEETYGSLSTAAATQVQDAYFRITPTSNATITAVTISAFNSYPGTTPTITACVAENAVTTGAFLCEVTAESTALTPTTSSISVAINYAAKATAAVGSTIDVTVDGNASVSGSATLANVGLATTASKGAIPDLTPGSLTAALLAPVTITENFSNAVTVTDEFRLIAPTGVAFQDIAAMVAASTSITSATLTATFAPNDTIVMTTASTATITFTPKAILASGLTGFVSFDLVNGNIDNKNGAGITSEPIMLAYADGTLGALDAGLDTSVNTSFVITNAVEGGLAPYTAKSGSTGIATVVVSGSNVNVTGKAVGNAVITVTDGLGATDTYVVTVAAGATQPAAKAAVGIGGSAGAATFTGGASTDGGATYADTFTTTDDVTIVGTVNVDIADQGTDGEIHVVILSINDAGAILSFVNEAGSLEAWDQTLEGLGAAEVATPLGATHTTVINAGNMAAGTYRVALAYSTATGKLVYTGKAVNITVTE